MRYVKSFQGLLDDIQRFAPANVHLLLLVLSIWNLRQCSLRFEDGGQGRLFTIKREEVDTIEAIEPGNTYAISGEKGFVEPRGGFPGHGSVSTGIRRARSSESMNRSPLPTPRGSPRPVSERLYNRPDQITPDSILIFLFLNGKGLQTKRLSFNKFQLNRGWPWFLEQLGKVYQVYPKKLRAMDGREVNHVDQLRQKGAYVLIPLGENFRDDTWYYLPDRAVDTSAEEDDSGARPKTRARRADGANPYEDDRTESARNSADSARYGYDDDYYSDQDSHRYALLFPACTS